MPDWNSDQYLKFARERTQPAIDLAARCEVESPRRVIDLGCGPGNSTAVLARRWPAAKLTGLDNSPDMIATARRDHPLEKWEWVEGDIAAWAATDEKPGDAPDVLFSNAALQWLPDHPRLLPRLLQRLAPGGALAVQMPNNQGSAPHRVMRELSESPEWQERFTHPARTWSVGTPERYHDILAGRAARLEIWETEYVHALNGVAQIVEWYKGTGLRPWLDALPDDATRKAFLKEYESALAPLYPRASHGKVLFPFRRLFFIAYQ